ncbi:hypothetical protein [Sulfolobus tengchongensis spindle-shaped virus 4]|nr:hypothetical protein [Sulfolobus tengchongensis spindle-shaped virus 4]
MKYEQKVRIHQIYRIVMTIRQIYRKNVNLRAWPALLLVASDISHYMAFQLVLVFLRRLGG